jgi:hypothetical protein
MNRLSNFVRLTWYRTGGYKLNFFQWLAWRLPRRLVYFAAIRLWAYGTCGDYGTSNATTITVDEALKRWERRDNSTYRGIGG